jgi:serine/threonine-protein kinase
LDGTIPTLICAGIGVFGSRVVYRLTRELSAERSMGSYQLEERIGGGGMGEVWRARHRLLARPAAIKFIRPELLQGSSALSPQDLVRRFEKEARATAALRSPHTVDLYDYGVADDGTFYYVMELLDGLDLKRMIDLHGPIPPERAVYLLRQACLSLGDAHESGLVHRDVKPANIYACRLGIEPDFVKVVDFGLVKGKVGPIEATAEMTADQLVRGTPAFMPPEVVMGKSDIDARSDLYSLGCVAYWLVTGRHVFEGPTALATLMQHTNTEPVPPSRFTSAPLPGELEDAILACLRKDPAARPASAAVLDERLARAASALPAWTRERAEAWWLEHHAGVAAVTA